jgi:signal peptidase II
MAWLEPLLTSVAVLAADQLSKRLVTARPRRVPAGAKRPFVAILYVLHRRGGGALWAGAPALLGLWAIAIAAAFVLLRQEPFGDSVAGAVGIGMAIGGVTGNLIDLLRQRAVTDFIAIGPWPVFNIADAALVAGLGLTLLAMA